MAKNSSALPRKIAQSLLTRIIAEEFPAGIMLPSERELQDEYKVSRAVIREAIKLLAARKIVEINWGQGVVVRSDLTEPVSDALLLAFHRSNNISLEDIFNIRLMLEPQIAALAAENATPTQIRRLAALAEDFEKIVTAMTPDTRIQRIHQWSKTDTEFHEALAEATQNPVLPMLIEVIIGIFWIQRQANDRTTTVEQFALSAGQHHAIAASVAARNADAAKAEMIQHLHTTWHNVTSKQNKVQMSIEALI